MNKEELIKTIFSYNPKEILQQNTFAKSYAPANFALIKYWGKQNKELMIPNTDSISVSLGSSYGTTTEIFINDKQGDQLILNDKIYNSTDKEFIRMFKFINLFRNEKIYLKILTKNDLATASGLATSASSFASVILSLNKLFNWKLSDKKLSMLARLGSISASRSIYKNGVVRLTKGKNPEFTCSKQIKSNIGNLYLGILEFGNNIKDISSSDGMEITCNNSLLYKYAWIKQVKNDINYLLKALNNGNWELFKNIVQNNALAMHATAISAGVIYWSDNTLNTIKKIIELQHSGIDICFTEDAGEHIKLLSNNENIIKNYFPKAKIIKLDI